MEKICLNIIDITQKLICKNNTIDKTDKNGANGTKELTCKNATKNFTK